ncbi:MAG: hypothetical protein LW715_10885 [Rhodobacter sp.]|jgi:hypothetical protein|nr:hypothetical protein [Rhodobacter sp.]
MFWVDAKPPKKTSGGTGSWDVVAADHLAALAPKSTTMVPGLAPTLAFLRV